MRSTFDIRREPGISRSYSNGSLQWETSVDTDSYQKSLDRSDVYRSPPPVAGWRMPTSYSVDDVVVNWLPGFQRTDTVLTYTNGYVETRAYEYRGPSNWLTTPQATLFTLDESQFSSLNNKNLLKLRDQKINVALAIGEMHKSIDTIASRASSLYQAYRHARRGNIKQAAKALGITTARRGKPVASNWLELQYGWLPMLMDIHGAYDELRRPFRSHGMRLKVTSRAEYTETVSDKTKSPDLYWNLSIDSSFHAERQLIYWYEVDNPYILLASATGVTNPMEILWEVTPWSFAIDWVLPIGDFLGALTADQGLAFLGGSQTTRTTTTHIRNATVADSVISGVYDGVKTVVTQTGFGMRTYRRKTMVRTAILENPTADLPSVKSPFTVGHALNAIALLRTLR